MVKNSLGLSVVLSTGLLLLSVSLSEAFAAELIDPTVPLGGVSAAPAEAKQSWQLQAVLRYENYWVAVINGKRVREGDMINGGLVAAIARNRVRLKQGDKWVNLTMRTALLTPSNGRN